MSAAVEQFGYRIAQAKAPGVAWFLIRIVVSRAQTAQPPSDALRSSFYR
jgi:hypothetical protein